MQLLCQVLKAARNWDVCVLFLKLQISNEIICLVITTASIWKRHFSLDWRILKRYRNYFLILKQGGRVASKYLKRKQTEKFILAVSRKFIHARIKVLLPSIQSLLNSAFSVYWERTLKIKTSKKDTFLIF